MSLADGDSTWPHRPVRCPPCGQNLHAALPAPEDPVLNRPIGDDQSEPSDERIHHMRWYASSVRCPPPDPALRPRDCRPLTDVSGIGNRSSQSVELRDHECVARAQRSQSLVEAGTLALRTADAVIDVDAIRRNAERNEGLALGDEVLLVGRASGVSSSCFIHPRTVPRLVVPIRWRASESRPSCGTDLAEPPVGLRASDSSDRGPLCGRVGTGGHRGIVIAAGTLWAGYSTAEGAFSVADAFRLHAGLPFEDTQILLSQDQ